ncbi:MAG: L-threonylcarbamoyladenylate synthase [Spirochaetota bacterium]
MALNRDLIVQPVIENIRAASSYLAAGRLVVMPTETVYGLAADAFNPLAVSRIFEAKQRPAFDPLICHISNEEMLERTVSSVSKPVLRLIREFWPGPLTVVLEKSTAVPNIVSSGLPTVAVRMPSHPVALKLIETFGGPLAAPSANMFGRLSPTRPEHTLRLEGDVASILDGGQCSVGVESTIVRYHAGKLYILRPGGITIEKLQRVGGIETCLAENAAIPNAPGQLPSHYAPHAPVIIINPDDPVPTQPERSCFLGFTSIRREVPFLRQETLAPDGDLHCAAANLFEALHRLDDCSPEFIIVESVPETGLGHAIMNRLRKSAAPRTS